MDAAYQDEGAGATQPQGESCTAESRDLNWASGRLTEGIPTVENQG